MRHWPVVAPLLALALLAVAASAAPFAGRGAASALLLVGAVVAAVHHAEVIAHRVGEPFGTLILSLAITIIEVALIVSLMLSGGPDTAALPRDTLYATVMIICNGVVGVCLLLGGLRHRVQRFQVEGTLPALAALVVLCVIVLVMPVFTTSSPEGTYTGAQLAFVGVITVATWAVYVFVQTVRHRDYFLPAGGEADDEATPHGSAATSALLLPASLVGVVGLAKLISPDIERLVGGAGLPPSLVGIAVAMLVLAPETWAAVRAARADRLQNSMNLALGSALASIGLTVPAVVVASSLLGLPLVLGLAAKDMAMLAMTFLVSAITLGSGRTYLMQGAVHLVMFAAFVFLAFVP